MSHRLVYVIGPSGAGKDSVLQGLRQRWPQAAGAHWARRCITRAAEAGGEQHESMDTATFERHRLAEGFAMHWTANGLLYGVRHSEIEPLRDGRWVFVNGSRGWLPGLLARWPDSTVVHISAAPDILAHRLSARGREAPDAIAARLLRQVPVVLPANSIHIENNAGLDAAVAALQQALQARDMDGMRDLSQRRGLFGT